MTETEPGPFDPETMTEYEQALVALRSGYTVVVTTPTGNRFEAMHDSGDLVVLDVTGERTQRGDDARERFETVLRTVGTEWDMHASPSDDAAAATGAGGAACPIHRQQYGDDSERGVVHPDDRTPLAYIYDGESLRATVFDEREVERYRDAALTVSLTPAGECRVDGECSVAGDSE